MGLLDVVPRTLFLKTLDSNRYLAIPVDFVEIVPGTDGSMEALESVPGSDGYIADRWLAQNAMKLYGDQL